MNPLKQINLASLPELNDLVWKQPKFAADHFELSSGKNLYAELTFTKILSDRAEAIGSHGAWILDRPGLFRDQVIVWNAMSNIETAWASREWFGDYKLNLSGINNLEFYRTKILANKWAMTREGNQLVYEIQFDYRWFKQYNPVSLSKKTIATFEHQAEPIEILLILGMYLGYCSMQDAAGAAAATVAAIS